MNTVATITLSAVGGAIVGGAITYAVTSKALMRRYEDWANSEIDSVKARYAQLNTDGKADFLIQAANPSPEVMAAVAEGKKLIEKMGYSETEEEPPHSTARTLSIFDQGVNLDEVDVEEEEEADEDGYIPVEGQPHLISEGEYFENEVDYQLDTLTYYEMDDTLTDDKDAQIPNVEQTVGERHLTMFKRSPNGGKTSLYIRNDDHETLYEIILVEASYAQVVLGMTEEELGIKPPKSRPKKMRDAD